MELNFFESTEADRAFAARALADADYSDHYVGAGTLAGLRAGTSALAAHQFVRQPLPEVAVRPVVVGGVACELLAPPDAGDEQRRILYLHGGGFVRGSLALGRANASVIAATAGVPVLTIGYRQAPEHPYPAAIDDILAVYCASLQAGLRAASIAVVGESSGGCLGLGLAAKLDAAGLPPPACIAALSPLTDLEMRGASWLYNAGKDVADRETGRAMVHLYMGERGLRDAVASPLLHHFRNSCPLLIAIGSHETLLSDAERLAWKADTAGAATRLDVYDAMPHGFTRFDMPLALQALANAAEWCRQRMAGL